MKSFTLKVSLAVSLLALISLVGALPTKSDSARAQLDHSQGQARQHRALPGVKPLSYRSPGATHKLMLPADDPELEQQLVSNRVVRKLKKYSGYSIAEVGDAELSTLDAASLQRASLRDDLNLVKVVVEQLDTTAPKPIIREELRQPQTDSRALHRGQHFGLVATTSLRA